MAEESDARMTERTPAERRLAGEIGAHGLWARIEDRSAHTAPARAAFDQQFLDAAEGDPIRASHLRAAYFKRLALKSARSRRKAKELLVDAAAAEAELKTASGGGGAA